MEGRREGRRDGGTDGGTEEHVDRRTSSGITKFGAEYIANTMPSSVLSRFSAYLTCTLMAAATSQTKNPAPEDIQSATRKTQRR
jgi:hypothetical protein